RLPAALRDVPLARGRPDPFRDAAVKGRHPGAGLEERRPLPAAARRYRLRRCLLPRSSGYHAPARPELRSAGVPPGLRPWPPHSRRTSPLNIRRLITDDDTPCRAGIHEPRRDRPMTATAQRIYSLPPARESAPAPERTVYL